MEHRRRRAHVNGTGPIPNYVAAVEADAPWLSQWGSIIGVVIGDGVTSIGNQAFVGCSCLNSITIPNSVTSIGYSAFAKCSGLTFITLPTLVTGIGTAAFSNCTGNMSGFEMINPATTPLAIGTDEFSGSNLMECLLRVPAASVNLYKAAAVWTIFWGIEAIDNGGGDDPCANPTASRLNWTLCPDSVLTINGTGLISDYTVGTAPWYSYRTSITTLVMEDGVTSIGEYAFYALSCLASATIPESENI